MRIIDIDLPQLTTARLILRIAHVDEAEAVVDYYQRNRTHLESTSPVWPSDFFEVHFWRKRLALNAAEFQQDTSLKLFLLRLESPHAIIGSANFNNFVRQAGQYCALGYSIDRDCQGQGLMTEALREAINYVFVNLNMHRILANYMPWNEKSARVLSKLGFEKEGFARQFLLINGKWEDHIMTALINQSWDPGRA